MDAFRQWHPNFPANLTNCKDEPIHVPGAIQGFGTLIAFDPSSRAILAVSENAPLIFPRLADFQTRPVPVHEMFDIREASELAGKSKIEKSRRLVEVFDLQDSRKKYFGVRYSAPGAEILEIEMEGPDSMPDAITSYLSNMPLMMSDIQTHATVTDLSDFVTRKIKEITGFDRVMVYRYDRDWNGQVIAEAKEEKLEPFLGLHYPASDIPPQARALYEKNWIRIIPTVHYKPSRILPEKFQSLDLSNSVLRSVSPIHIRYLRNMGVGASMSISLMVEGKLWGLVACHHYSPHLVPLDIRMGCEAYGQLISWHIKTLESSKALKDQLAGEKTLQSVLETFGRNDNFKQAAHDAEKDLLALFDANGIVIRLGDEIAVLGENPGDFFADTVAKVVTGHSILEPLVTDDIGRFPPLSKIAPVIPRRTVAGVMALALSPHHNYYILCTRPELKRTVKWAGNPQHKESVDFSKPGERLAPRGSFALWEELHEGQSRPWAPESAELLKKFGLLFFKIVIERKEIVEKANNELKALNRAKDEFVAMVSHELRTPLNAIIGWTDLALSDELKDGQMIDALKVIQRNARSQNQLIGDLLDASRIISGKMQLQVRKMRLSEVVEAVILSFQPATEAKAIRIIPDLDREGDVFTGDPDRLQQVIWNLLSNAVKFSPQGSSIRVEIKRQRSHLELKVQDQGVGLKPEDLERIFGRFQQVESVISRKTGLGLGLSISKHLVELHGGRIEVASEGPGKGSVFNVSFPLTPPSAAGR
ncbi:MAG: GAF domain-containing protein [Bdellovibrionaceae bacterium]|nr:GAF domain-containing protein [Pseudobdellovibrionaceae bacterium]